MKIILKEEVSGLGVRGDVTEVKDGYARNYLLPKDLAMRFTPGAHKVLEQERRVYEIRQVKAKEEAEALGEKLSALELSIAKKVGEQDVLYGSVTAGEVAEMLKAKGFVIDKRKILLNEPIKKIGDFEIGIRLHAEVVPNVHLSVTKEE